MKRSSFLKLTLILCVCVILTSCSTKKNTFISRNYHTLTCYYNVYWNGKESFKEGQSIISAQGLDNFYEVLPVCQFGSIQDTQYTYQAMNRVIEKSAKAIKKHSIFIRGVEYVKYVDDSYLLLGAALVYKHSFSNARMIFNFVISQYAKNPEKYEAMLWIARTHILEGEFDMAEAMLGKVESALPLAKKETQAQFPLVMIDFYIAQGQYKLAIPLLENALGGKYKKDLKSRMAFILGQIYQRENDFAGAYRYYKLCLKRNPPLDMGFNARLNLALCYDNSNMSSVELEADLLSMLKDEKNSKYFSRIYYVLGVLMFKDEKIPEGIAYYKKSIELSGDDPERMLLSARTLAEYYYSNQNFLEAQKYYQICSDAMQRSDPDYFLVKNRSDNLNELLTYSELLRASDSVLTISKMSKAEMDIYAQAQVDAYKKREEQRKINESKALKSSGPQYNSKWYFYNEQSKRVGHLDFTKKWGRRTNEDFWFMSSKPPMEALRPLSEIEDDGFDESEDSLVRQEKLGPTDKEYYLKALASSPEEFQALSDSIEVALFQLGCIYFNNLGELNLAEKNFIRLLDEYPQTEKKPFVYQMLCLLYAQQKKTAEFNKYAQALAKEYPGSEADQKINDPQYSAKLLENSKQVGRIYEEAYLAYEKADYYRCLALCDMIDQKYPVNDYKPQLLFIKSVSIGHVKSYKLMADGLEELVKSYPASELIPKAKHLLEMSKPYLEGDAIVEVADLPDTNMPKPLVVDTVVAPKVEEPEPKFQIQPQSTHFVVVLVKKGKVNTDVLQIKISDFNRKFFSEEKLKVSVDKFDDTYLQLLISEFPTSQLSNSYYKTFIKNEYIFGSIEVADREVFFISVDNYTYLLQHFGIPEYLEFFKSSYF